MNKIHTRLFITMAIILGLSGCNSAELFTKKDQPETIVSTPSVTERISEIKQQEQKVQALIITADAALMNGDFVMAKQDYQHAIDIKPNNVRAQEGLRRSAIFEQHAASVEQAKILMGKTEQGDQQAADILRHVLVEDPSNEQAGLLYKAIIDHADAKRLASMKKKLKYDHQVSLEFRDTQFKIIIEALAKGTGVNFILDKDVRSNLKASLFIRDVSLEEAIDMLVQSNQLKKKILSENSVVIYPDTALKTRQYQDLIIRSFFLEHADPQTVSKLLKSMLGIKQIQTDDRLPMLMIKDVPEVMVLAEKLIKSQDIAEPEVMLEMQILEVRRTADSLKGVTWPTQFTVLGAGTSLETLKGIGSTDIGVAPNPALVFEGKDVDANLLANPRIRVKNGEKAKIHIGDRVPVITSNVSSNGVISDNVQYIDSGLKLEVQPEISMAGDVSIKINLDVSSIGDKITTNTGAVVPQIGTRSTSTELRLKDGETQVLAGLINDEERTTVNKVPGLGDLPVIGRLFSKHFDEKVKTELILTITPRIIRPRQSPDAALAEYWMGTEFQVGRGMGGPKKRTREEISKMFKAGIAPGSVNKSAVSPKQAPDPGLNIKLPPGLTSSF